MGLYLFIFCTSITKLYTYKYYKKYNITIEILSKETHFSVKDYIYFPVIVFGMRVNLRT